MGENAVVMHVLAQRGLLQFKAGKNTSLNHRVVMHVLAQRGLLHLPIQDWIKIQSCCNACSGATRVTAVNGLVKIPVRF